MRISRRGHQSFILLNRVILVFSILFGYGTSTKELEAADYTPLPGYGWAVSTPEKQGLDPMLYFNATKLETLYGLLVIKNGHLIAEGYFNK